MRWKVTTGLLVFAATIIAFIGMAAGPAQAGGNGSSFSVTFGSQHHPHWNRHPGSRHGWRHDRRRAYFARHYWPRPWPVPVPLPPQVVYVEPPRAIAPTSSAPQEPFCREFQKQIVIDGRTEQAYGIACLQPVGTWKIQP